MKDKLILWAQALDNLSPDHFQMRGLELEIDNSNDRQEAVSLASKVTKFGVCIFDNGGVKLTIYRQHFVVKVLSIERDCAGRLAPIICYGGYSTDSDINTISDSVAAAIGEFALKIGRNIQSEHVELIRDSFKKLKKKLIVKKKIMIFFIVVIIILAILLMMVARDHQ